MAVRVELTSTGRQLELGLVTGVTNTQLVILTLHLSFMLTCCPAGAAGGGGGQTELRAGQTLPRPLPSCPRRGRQQGVGQLVLP